MQYDRDAVSPWAFFLPIALAVMVGSLVADALGHLMRGRFAEAPVAVVAEVSPAAVAAPEPTPPPAPLPQPVLPEPALPAAPVTEPPQADAALPAAAPAPSVIAAVEAPSGVDAPRRLSGPMTARQAGESESCINNTVATRSPNGWEQALENDAPVRCEASSP
ncbi:hypothetical protein [Luteimonas sp. 100069]|uniref:hypothetical protein n=1 Tax=Luteimonas sp. 100069 TaxID=2006109 RepID=UPI000F4E8220|nr:hypothetical protein [Luteimonas sp. 100069]RPD88324.1 hypothetical protein EGK76_03920 [Luteimonas sp. 100069]